MPLFILVWPIYLYAQPIPTSPAQAQGRLIENIAILGLEKTQANVVRRELLIAEAQVFDRQALDDSIQQLKNLRLFSRVSSDLFMDDGNKIHVVLNLQEKWTTIPIVKYTQGGQSTYFVAGAYDINTQGTLIETGAQYESWNGEPGTVIWFRNPRIMDRKIRLGGDIWFVKRPRELYQQDGTNTGSYLLDRKVYNLFIDGEIAPKMTLGAGIE